MITKLEDLREKQIQDLFNNLVSNFGFKIVAVFDLKNQMLIGLYNVSQISVQDEQNRKTFLITGKSFDANQLIQQSNWQYSLKSDMEKINPVSVTYSENMFGFVGYGLRDY